jgi:hypothetical protein
LLAVEEAAERFRGQGRQELAELYLLAERVRANG